jgi:Protein of unknown function (DUF1566)
VHFSIFPRLNFSAVVSRLQCLPLSISTCITFGMIALSSPAIAQITAVPALNDTGINKCYNDVGEARCETISSDSGTHPRQDGRYGRDAKPELVASSTSRKGFAFTRVCNNGEDAGSGSCPEIPVLGNGASDWGCTKDNVTRRMWEMKPTGASELRSATHTYSWYSTNVNGGNSGDEGSGTCSGTIAGNRCNTQAFISAVNTANLCSATGWRLPNKIELQTLLDLGKAGIAVPVVDIDNFPNTQAGGYWTSSTNAQRLNLAWVVYFNDGLNGIALKSSGAFVRLVRSF